MHDHNEAYSSRIIPYLYLLPTLAILIIFLFYPAWKSILLSLYRSNLFLGTRKFIGLENLKNLFVGPLAPGFRQVLVQTIIFSGLVVGFGLSLSLFIAIQANKDIKGAKVYRMLLIWPFALSPAIAATIYLFMFNPEIGIVNTLLNALFGIKPRWLDAPLPAFFLTVCAAVWKNLGYNIVFYLAALQSIPKTPLEAADIDGTNGWQKFRYIVFPLLSPTTFFLLFTNITYSFFDSFGIIDMLTKGGPVGSGPFFDHEGVTTTLMYKMYLDGFGGSSNMGFAAAEALVLMCLVALTVSLQFKFFEKRVHYEG
ncbi:sugar ABC transporter permease [uncultured Sphaerochaeta sp.]|uniref:carbohydrate ABC transporter permease n=1 Tax=uncultured Sphaerochaeta sp. TaxID=886478 RepID=UPI002A0A5593|nr:sugar ABC transporter permease [uncultured Sphaerochaeta sp.]